MSYAAVLASRNSDQSGPARHHLFQAERREKITLRFRPVLGDFEATIDFMTNDLKLDSGFVKIHTKRVPFGLKSHDKD